MPNAQSRKCSVEILLLCLDVGIAGEPDLLIKESRGTLRNNSLKQDYRDFRSSLRITVLTRHAILALNHQWLFTARATARTSKDQLRITRTVAVLVHDHILSWLLWILGSKEPSVAINTVSY